MNEESPDLIERIGFVLSLVILIVGLADIAAIITLLPTAVYLVAVWVVAIGLWAYQKYKTT